MGAKGDRAAKEPLAIRLYADGKNLVDIGKQLDISDTTLRRWKSESQVPGEEIDGWDKARQQKRGNVQRLKDLFERELKFAEKSDAGSISSPSMDALSKLGALVQRWEVVERAEAMSQTEVKPDIDRPVIFLEILEWLAKELKDLDPEGLKVIARNFDALIVRFKAEHAKTA